MPDQTLTCIERSCGATFTFSDGEQKFYAEKGFTPPKRCPNCRAARKAHKDGAAKTGGGAPSQSPGQLVASAEFEDGSDTRRGRRDRRNDTNRRRRPDYD